MMRRIILLICVLGSAVCFIYAAVWLADGWGQKNVDKHMAESFHQTPFPNEISANNHHEVTEPPRTIADNKDMEPQENRFSALSDINPDLVGWITINGTAIDYPVVQGKDNEQYLYVDFQGKSSKRGTIFMDYRCNADSRINILYGHRMKDGTMFHDLYDYSSKDYRSEHSEILFYPLSGGTEAYYVFDVLYWDVTIEHEKTLYEYIKALDNGEEKLLALATCDNSAVDARFIVISKQKSKENGMY